MTYPDLTPARLAVERLLADTCTIERDRAGIHDDVLDETTGALVPPIADSFAVWSGPCLVNPQGWRDQDEFLGPLATTKPLRGDYRGLIPLAAPAVEAGDTLTINVAARDPQLTGQTFRVVEIGEVNTFAIVRIIGLERL